MSTELAVAGRENAVIAATMYDKIDNPLEFIKTMGTALAQSGVAGCKNPAQGQVMAWACLSLRKNPFEIADEYHMMDGKLTIKSDAALANFQAAGGKSKWIKDGQNRTEAIIELIGPDGVRIESRFTIEMADLAGLIKRDPKGNPKEGQSWISWTPAMLRSRCITEGIRMQWPHLLKGKMSTDEMQDVIETTSVVKSTSRATKSEPEKKIEDSKDVEVSAESAVAGSPEIVNTATAEKPPFDIGNNGDGDGDANESSIPTSSDATFQVITLEIESLISQCRMTVEKVLSTYNKQFGTEHVEFGQFSEEQQATILGKLRGVKEKIDRGELIIKDGVLMKA